MTREELHQNMISFMEKERAARGWSIERMADAVRLPPASYRNIIYGRTNTIDIEVACRLFELTGRWMYEMCGYKGTSEPVVDHYCALSEFNKKLIFRIYEVIRDSEEESRSG